MGVGQETLHMARYPRRLLHIQGRVKAEGHESSLWDSHPVMVTRRPSSFRESLESVFQHFRLQSCVFTPSQHKRDGGSGGII